MAKKDTPEYVYLKLTGEASVFTDPGLGLKLVRDIPAKVEKGAFQKALKRKNPEFKNRFGSHFQQISEGEFNALMAVAEEAKTTDEAAKAKKLDAAVAKLTKKFGKSAVVASAKKEVGKDTSELVENDDEDEDDDDANDDGTFEGMSKNEIIDWMVENDEDTDEDDRKELKKKTRDDLVALAKEIEEGLEEDEDEE